MRTVKIVQYGIGPIGVEVVKYALVKQGTKFIGAVDVDECMPPFPCYDFITRRRT